jgi:hypothetical protein
LTFQEMHHVKPKLSDLRATPNTKASEFKVVAAAVCWGLLNCRKFSGFHSDKESISAVFEVDSVKNRVFSSSGLVSLFVKLWHWETLLNDAFKLIESLREELFKSRAGTQKVLSEKENASTLL